MRFLIGSLCFFAGMAASAAPTNRVIKCNLVIVAEGAPGGTQDVNFERPEVAPGGHGGEYLPFEFGPHIVLAQVDGKWRSIYWVKGETVIANIVTATAESLHSDQALIVINPNNDQEQVSLSCSLNE